MDRSTKRKVVAGSVAALAVAGGGAAIAATKLASPKEESQAIVNDAAKQLGVQPSALSNALKKALENRVDAAVAAGRITKAQGEELKKRIESGDVPLFFGGPRGFHHGPGGPGGPGRHHLGAAASYLGLTEAQLRAQLESGKTLAQVAKAKNKSVDGVVAALVADEKKELDAAVAAGRITKAQEQQLLTEAKQRFTDMVNGKFKRHERGEHGPGSGFRAPFGADPSSVGPSSAGTAL
ncbi:MAG: hypothetical protein M3R70_06605 [Actinomycetota bacterium]|nr:hypothetical protein [Actinomycetota bacterium]